MKFTVSQVRPLPELPPQLRAIIGNPGIAAVLEARAAQRGEAAVAVTTAAAGATPGAARLSLPGLLSPASPAVDPDLADRKLDTALFAALGLEPKSTKLFPQLMAMVPREHQMAARGTLGELEKAAQAAVGKGAFGAGVFLLGVPDGFAKVTDGTLTPTARLAAGGKFAAGAVKALEPFVPALAPSAPVLRDSLMLLTAPDALGKALDPDQPAFSRLTAAGKLLVTGATLAAHFVPAMSPYAAQISTVGWLCDVGDKTYAAFVEVSK
ncbi:hypothetical protein J8J14_09920 [Roseomonas sp. SSH11]|uniref:Uncharacterized protein n=1 Tax=Pararoseomonas baculiformis TaxID=2820812 RepID=A0ABS4ADL6_9PROT|nr:hypothetical protein [Pararoseomonas baculiformis]MBP0445098.1 hypothetical protein [Pararoseomonas baculiformis]